ncbi:MAG TPA: glucose-6-phosphate isomerase [Methylococcaceae bacterium]|nr:glucose-6-phosphate isomerase [Methylococcaceae bacterium]HIB61648.1 glucose-6-phosphate isomerase [Methylococcaceae bacterium]HIN67873.1 glucose-6-phosphate isomerase [Methylococcales bacterium]
MPELTESAIWQSLNAHYENIRHIHMRDLFEQDPNRFENFSLHINDLLFDFSKNRITKETLNLLIDLANHTGLKDQIEAMFRGDKINITENRPALHTALRRSQQNKTVYVNNEDITPEINRVLDKIEQFCDQIRSGKWRGYSGKKITNIVNIGIGGSDLGPKMVLTALQPYATENIKVHFVSNIDQANLIETISNLAPETTLFIISSKTFTTQETMTNAHSAKQWLMNSAQNTQAISKHFVAISANRAEAINFGIASDNIFEFWDWVGGRYSLWSAIGLSIAISIGFKNFCQLLLGANDIDNHFRLAPFERNIPVIMALLGIWYNNFFNAASHAILPYAHSLRYLSDYLQQCDMESNGKSIDRDGLEVNYETGPIIWGQSGPNGQHAFFQLIHQGTKLVPCDFIAPACNRYDSTEQHAILLSNFLAQPEALMQGQTIEQVKTELNQDDLSITLLHSKTFSGNRPSNSFLFKEVTPKTVGSLIALYEHKTFVQGCIWNINSFDQMGVELGKKLAYALLPELNNNQIIDTHDSSTNGLINYYKKIR